MQEKKLTKDYCFNLAHGIYMIVYDNLKKYSLSSNEIKTVLERLQWYITQEIMFLDDKD